MLLGEKQTMLFGSYIPLFVLFVCLFEVRCIFEKNRIYNHVPANDGKTCGDFIIDEDTGALGSLLGCMAICSPRGICKTVFYNTATKDCTRCKSYYEDGDTNLVDSAVTVISYMRMPVYNGYCRNDAHCLLPLNVCYDMKCYCMPGYMYNYTAKTCVTECDTLGNTYNKYWGTYLYNYGYGTHNGNFTVRQCEDYCTSQPWCISFDYNPTAYCRYYNITALTYLDNYVTKKNATSLYHYQRNCKK